MYDSNFYKKWDIIKFDAENTIQIASLKTGKRITFTFEKILNQWIFEDIDVLNPHGKCDPKIYYLILQEKGKIPTLDSNDNCKLYIKENYQAISKLLNNSDSLYNLILIVYPDNLFKEFKDSINFTDFFNKYKNGFYIIVDKLFEADSTYKLENITLFNKICIKIDRSSMDTFPFYFLKKNGVWQFYDKKLEYYPYFP
jgi:hypothetical protein